MSPNLHIQLLGEFRLLVDGQPLTSLNKPRGQALLAYLLLHRRAPQPRQQLAFTFWPDSLESQAYTNLRKLFFQLRAALPQADTFLSADSQTIGWRKDAPFSLDVAELEQTLDLLQNSTAPAPGQVERVVTLYGGELLPACYDEWIFPVRRALHERVINTLLQALPGLAARHEYQAGLRAGQHILRLDPPHEAAYRHLMYLLALSGDRAGALRVYHECVTVLERELAVAPTTETQTLYQQLMKTELQPAPAAGQGSGQRNEHVPLIGRKIEWQTLQQAWQEMGRRGPQLVTVWGEAGVGKTRLVEELLHWAKMRPGAVVYARAYAAEGALAYAPLTEWLRSEPLYKAVTHLEGIWQTEIARLLPELLTARPDLPAPAPMDESWQRQRFFEALARAIVVAAPPLLLALDDMQWCDAEMLAWLRYLLHFAAQTPLLIVGTVRSEEVGEGHPLHELVLPLQRMGQYQQIELAPLSLEETTMLAGHLTAEDVERWGTRLYQETEGNPLFIVEMVRAAIFAEHGRQAGQAVALPPTVQAVIAARLDQLSPPARKLAQLAATIGRSFTFEMLEAAGNIATDSMVQALDELWQRRIVRERGNRYDFSHDKIREGAYTAITPMRRRLLHRQVAEGLEQLYRHRIDEVAGELATHYRQAGESEKALRYFVQAGDRAQQLAAKQEALRYFQEALALAQGQTYDQILARRAKVYLDLYQGQEAVLDFQYLLTCARQSKDRQQEMMSLLGLVNAYYLAALDAQMPDAAEEVRSYYMAAQALARQLGDRREIVHSLLLPIWHFWPELREQAIVDSQEALLLSRELGDQELIIDSKLALLYNSRNHAQAKIGDEVSQELRARQDLDRLNQATFYLMWTHYNLGNYRRAVSVCDDGIELAAKLGILPVQYPTLKAFALLRLGRYTDAWQSLQQEIADEGHRLARAFKAVGTGMYLYELGVYPRAVCVLEQVMAEAENLRRGWLCEWARIWLVRSLLPLGQPADAQWSKAQQALAAADQEVLGGLEQWQALTIFVQAEMALAEARAEEALQLAQKAGEMMRVNEFQGDLVAVLELQARALLCLSKPAAALTLLTEAYETGMMIGVLPVLWRVHATKAQTLESLGQIQAASQERQLAAGLIAGLAVAIDDDELRQGFIADPCRAAVIAGSHHSIRAGPVS